MLIWSILRIIINIASWQLTSWHKRIYLPTQVEQMYEDQDTGIAAIGWEGYVDDRQLSNYVVWECCWRQGRQQQDGAANSETVPPALVDSGWNTNAAYR